LNLPVPAVTVVVPTLAVDSRLLECVSSLQKQTFRDFGVTIVDNSGKRLAQDKLGGLAGVTVVDLPRNLGFGSAVNEGWRRSESPLVATLNDDAVAHAGWLAGLVRAMESDPQAGMCASQVRLYGEDQIDSAGMLIAGDGSSKQRGHLNPYEWFQERAEVLLPSGSAALYRRAMLDQIGCFDGDFFLYCEDTDLGLRARWAGWKCLYVPDAVVEHHYSHSAGRASPLKAYYVERNRLFVLVKNFPAGMLARAPFVALARYVWHVIWMLRGRGSAARFRQEGNSPFGMVFLVIRAHFALLRHWRALWRKRKQIRGSARVSPRDFRRLLQAHAITARQVAEL
jgi:GT2 family glycosyltransferase